MADNSGIEWTDATWNPVTGCMVVSPGCTNCYAMKLAGGRLAHHPSRAGLTKPSKAGPIWTGDTYLNEDWIDQPLRWKRPRRIFVCAHGDLFYEGVPDAWIDKVFAVMALAPQHTFQVLTKRSARMRAYEERAGHVRDVCYRPERYFSPAKDPTVGRVAKWPDRWPGWPLPNVWMGVSAEDQARADERIPDLLATPAALRFVSAEPLLGPIDLNRIHETFDDGLGHSWESSLNGRRFDVWGDGGDIEGCPKLDWVIAGGESGPGARPMHPDWARGLRDQCAAGNVPFFFKQWGEFVSVSEVAGPGAHFSFPDGATVRRTGKAIAGRTLDGRTWDGMPPCATT